MPNINENEVLWDALSSLNEEVPPMSEGLHAAWMQKVEEDMENKQTPKFHIPQTVTRWLSAAAALVFIIGGIVNSGDAQLDKPSGSSGSSRPASYDGKNACMNCGKKSVYDLGFCKSCYESFMDYTYGD